MLTVFQVAAYILLAQFDPVSFFDIIHKKIASHVTMAASGEVLEQAFIYRSISCGYAKFQWVWRLRFIKDSQETLL